MVRPHLAGRAPHLRTFFDDFLLGGPLERYHAEPWRAERLNAAERVLLATRLQGEARDTLRGGHRDNFSQTRHAAILEARAQPAYVAAE